MTNFATALKKIIKRKKRNGYYEANDILTLKEKNALITVITAVATPLLISVFILFLG